MNLCDMKKKTTIWSVLRAGFEPTHEINRKFMCNINTPIPKPNKEMFLDSLMRTRSEAQKHDKVLFKLVNNLIIEYLKDDSNESKK